MSEDRLPDRAEESEASTASWPWLFGALVVTVAGAWVVIGNVAPWLLGPAPFPPEWLWPWELLSWAKWQTWLHAGAVALYAAMAILLLWPRFLGWSAHRRVQVGLIVAVLAFVGLQLALGWARKDSLLDMVIFRTYNPPGNGYFMSAVRAESLSEVFHNYQAAMPNFPHDRPQTHPPGIFTYYAAFVTLFRALPDFNAWFAPIARGWALADRDWVQLQDAYISAAFFSGWLQLFIGMWAPIAFYLLLKRLQGNKGSSEFALAGALMLPVLPAVNSFYTHWDVNYLLVTSAAWLLALRAQENLFAPGQRWTRWLDWVWAGLLLWLLTWFSFGNSVFLGIVGLHLVWRQLFVLPGYFGTSWKSKLLPAIGGAAILASAIVLPWLALYFTLNMNFLGLLHTGMARHYVIATAARDFSIWVWMNLVDFALWLGFGIALLAIASSIWLLMNRTRGYLESNLWGLVLIFWGVLLALDLSGSARAEIGRLWLFFMPIPLMFVIAWQRDWRQRAVILAMLAVTAWAMGYAVRAV